MRGFTFCIAVLLMTTAAFTPAHAQDQKKDAAPAPATATTAQAAPEKHKPAQSSPPTLDHDNPYTDKVQTQALALAKALNDDQSKAVSKIMGGFDSIHKIRNAEDDVRKAVDSCARHNPDMAQKMNDRFDKWKGAVDPALAQNEKNMAATIKTGIAGDPQKITDYFDLVDKYETYEESKITKNPAASAKACDGLLGSMDRTQDNLANLLKEIKWPVQEEKPAKEDKKEDKSDAAPAPAKEPEDAPAKNP